MFVIVYLFVELSNDTSTPALPAMRFASELIAVSIALARDAPVEYVPVATLITELETPLTAIEN